MPGYVVLPQNQNPLMSMFPQLIMQGLAYKQQDKLQEQRQKQIERQEEREDKRLGSQIGLKAMLEGRDVIQTDSEKVPEGYIQNPYNTTQFIGPEQKTPWQKVMVEGKLIGFSDGKAFKSVKDIGLDYKPQLVTYNKGSQEFTAEYVPGQGLKQIASAPRWKNEQQELREWKPRTQEEALEFYESKAKIDKLYTIPKSDTKDPSKLRNEFLRGSKTFVEVQDAYRRVQASVQDPSAAGDVSLIFNFMKILDPQSVVREGEFATAENAQGIPLRVRNMYNKAMSGERLAPEARKDFVTRSGLLFNKQLEGHKQLVSEYDRLAKSSGVEPSDVIVNYVIEEKYNDEVDRLIKQYGKH